ncbi:coiled-coil domain-containing protein 1-like [Schistocerca nitens]|uniref:coiled-coil domain-containing protein 1-like n=1 Tax=Schistocerca nitens TaxID=7011 RepID=UPI0021184ABE|nr:coiled-coil domain-containing protein 1-like [Schistocerca nitens]
MEILSLELTKTLQDKDLPDKGSYDDYSIASLFVNDDDDDDDDDVAVERFDVVAEIHADACDSDDDDDDDDDNVNDILFQEELDGMIFVEVLGHEVNNIDVREILANSNDKNEQTEQIGYNVLEVLNKQEIREVKCMK